MQKTRKAVAKRFSVTGSGKIKHKRSGLRHILTNKSKNRKRKFRQKGILPDTQRDHVLRNLPYGALI